MLRLGLYIAVVGVVSEENHEEKGEIVVWQSDAITPADVDVKRTVSRRLARRERRNDFWRVNEATKFLEKNIPWYLARIVTFQWIVSFTSHGISTSLSSYKLLDFHWSRAVLLIPYVLCLLKSIVQPKAANVELFMNAKDFFSHVKGSPLQEFCVCYISGKLVVIHE